MSLDRFLRNVYYKMHRQGERLIRHSYQQAKDYITSFPEPQDDIDRAYYQYLCQKWDTMGKLEFFLLSIGALFLFIPQFLIYRCKKRAPEDDCDSVITFKWLKDLIPAEYMNQYAIQDFDGGTLTDSDAKYLRTIIRRHPLSFLFNYKIMRRVAAYSDSISRYSPTVIFASAEFSFTSSLLTNYCEICGVKHINIMHGEKRYNVREAFCRFTVFYVWDEYYKELLLSLRADKTEYLVFKMNVPDVRVILDKSRCTYYLQLHTREQLEIIKSSLEKTGRDYLVRPHPVYSDGIENEVFGLNHIESDEVDIWESIGI